LHGSLGAASVEAESVEVRDGDFLVLCSHSTWAHLACDKAVQAVNGWMREQGPERLSRDGHEPQDRRTVSLIFPGRMRLSIGERDLRALGGGTVHRTRVPTCLARSAQRILPRTDLSVTANI
jgi:hypothetical protein